MALATARQLWRLNKEGRLGLLEMANKTQPIPPEVADAAIQQGIEAGLTYDRRAGLGSGAALGMVDAESVRLALADEA